MKIAIYDFELNKFILTRDLGHDRNPEGSLVTLEDGRDVELGLFGKVIDQDNKRLISLVWLEDQE
jgi:ABC-type phosphonate transport system ATPase subunit